MQKKTAQKKRPTVVLDFDAVLAEYDGWKGYAFMGKPRKGVREFLEKLEKAGVSFIVLTTREDTKAIHAWFVKHRLPKPERVTNEKPLAHAYVDDRAVRFNGDYEELLAELKEFHVYWNRRRKPFQKL